MCGMSLGKKNGKRGGVWGWGGAWDGLWEHKRDGARRGYSNGKIREGKRPFRRSAVPLALPALSLSPGARPPDTDLAPAPAPPQARQNPPGRPQVTACWTSHSPAPPPPAAATPPRSSPTPRAARRQRVSAHLSLCVNRSRHRGRCLRALDVNPPGRGHGGEARDFVCAARLVRRIPRVDRRPLGAAGRLGAAGGAGGRRKRGAPRGRRANSASPAQANTSSSTSTALRGTAAGAGVCHNAPGATAVTRVLPENLRHARVSRPPCHQARAGIATAMATAAAAPGGRGSRAMCVPRTARAWRPPLRRARVGAALSRGAHAQPHARARYPLLLAAHVPPPSRAPRHPRLGVFAPPPHAGRGPLRWHAPQIGCQPRATKRLPRSPTSAAPSPQMRERALSSPRAPPLRAHAPSPRARPQPRPPCAPAPPPRTRARATPFT